MSAGERREHPLPQLPPPISVPEVNGVSRNHLDAHLPIPPAALVSPTTSSGNVTPISPMNPGREQKPPKKANPLVDLIDTERVYVDLLGGIIRKVAAAWSRSNLPPKQLDAVFRAVEGVYKANRSLLNRLNEIGPKPTSPKALGDLLMRWIDDLDSPYTRYSQTYLSSFNDWQPIKDNNKLPKVLSDFSNEHPPLLVDPASSETLWSLDSLLILPRTRLKYYKRLYGRLLKSTSPGRSDYQLLQNANEKLDNLATQLEVRSALKASDEEIEPLKPATSAPTPASAPAPAPAPAPTPAPAPAPTPASAPAPAPATAPTLPPVLPLELKGDQTRLSSQSSSQASISTNGERLSQGTANTSLVQQSSPVPDTNDIERSISTVRTLDIFTMRPRQVKLSLQPPGLPLTRQLRISCDTVIRITPRSDGIERVHPRGHIFLMSDLFLVCEQLGDKEKEALRDSIGPNDPLPNWALCYPPLAARHLSVQEVGDLAIEVHVMKKEILMLELADPELKAQLAKEFRAAVSMATALASASKGQNGLPPSPLASKDSSPINTPRGSVQPNAIAESSRLPNVPLNPPPPYENPSQQPLAGQPPFRAPPPSSRDGHGQFPPHPRDMRSPPPSDPISRPGLQSIAQPQPMPLPPDIPNMLGPLPLINGQDPAHFMPNGQPPRLYSAPPNPGEPYKPPPRGASIATRGPAPPFPPSHKPNSAPGRENGYSIAPSFSDNVDLSLNFPNGNLPRPSSRASTDPSSHNTLRKAPSSRSLRQQPQLERDSMPLPPVPLRDPMAPGNFARNPNSLMPALPSDAFRASQAFIGRAPSHHDISPPSSPTEGRQMSQGPVTSTISAQMKCKVFLKQQHASWKSLGAARLKLYHQQPTNVKQLVVEADTKDHPIIISTIILTDGVERVGKTGVAIELSDKGTRTGIVYMIQLRNETSASGLFDQLLLGSDRTARPG